MKITLAASLLFLTLSQTACLTTVETLPHPHHHQHGYHHHRHHHGHTVQFSRPRPVYVPVYRPARTVVTVRRY